MPTWSGTKILNNRTLRQLKHIAQLVVAILALWSCQRVVLPDNNQGQNDGKGIGQMVLFTVGTTNTSITTKAEGDGDGGDAGGDEGGSGSGENSGITTTPGKTYYMPNNGRFVCRMYYKANAGGGLEVPYDLSDNTKTITWLKVSGNVGNSLYWNKEYNPVEHPEVIGEGGVDSYGNDYSATAFYWQNRKKHAFLAWTDLNKLTTIKYSPIKNSGGLKFEPADETYQKHTGEKRTQWINGGYEVYPDHEFKTFAQLRTFMEAGANYENEIKGKVPAEADFDGQYYYYEYGWSCKFRYEKDYHYTPVDEKHRMSGWKEYQMFYDKLPYTGETPAQNEDIIYRRNSKYVPTHLYHSKELRYLAQIDIKFYKLDSEGNPTTTVYIPEATDINIDEDNKILDLSTVKDGDKIKKADGDQPIAQCKFVYNLTDNYGNEKYDETNPRYTFYFRDLEEEKDQEVIEEYKANVFDLTRKPKGDGTYEINSISGQPDIIQALTEQEPLGATQESNRVNLYFKHQFSQVQVNLKTSADLSVVIDKDDIRKVELLGVSEKGYVFTELNEQGKVEPATYEHVDISKYSDEHLKKNQYGTAFEMFDMKTSEEASENYGYPVGYIKAYNAITFGQLQAIRVTWVEHGTGIEHESTYQVGNEELKNLKSGNKYVWNIELRRGTLAIVRTEIVDWIVPADELEYGTNGTISN